MNSRSHSKPVAFAAGLALLATSATSSSQGISIETATTALDVVTTTDFVHTFDTTVRSSAADHNFTAGAMGTDILMSAGHHLVIYNWRFDRISGRNRSEIQTNLNLAGVDLPAGWSQGYIRTDNGQAETITAGGAIIDVASANDVLQLQSFRTDNNGSGVERANGATGIQLLKLDDNWDYLRLNAGGVDPDQTLPGNTTTWLDVAYDTEVEKDALSFGFTASGSDITLVQQGHYLVFANTYCDTGGGQDRDMIVQRLTLGGTEIDGSRTSVYIRGNQNSSHEGAASLGMIIETAAPNQILNVEILQDVGRSGTVNGARTAVSIVKLPDTADYVRLVDNEGASQNLNPASAAALAYDDTNPPDTTSAQVELDAAFAHSTTTDPSQVGVVSGGDYLFLAAQYVADDGVQRGFPNQGWQVNGTGGFSAHGQTGRYSRNAGGVDKLGNWSGFIAGLNASDYVEHLTVALGNGGTNNGETLALQGLRIDNIFGPDTNPPIITALTPADDEPEFFTGDSIVATFNEPITLLNGGTITVKDLDLMTDTVITLPDVQATSPNGNDLLIAPSGGLAFGTNYAIQIGANAIEDQAAVPNAFAGILNDTDWNFTTLPQDLVNPTFTTLNPADDATDVAFNLGTLSITFDEIVEAGTGNITITNVTDATTFATLDVTNGAEASIVNDTLTLTVPSNFEVTKEYAVQIPGTAILDRSANTFAGIADNTTWSFTIEAFPAPVAYWPMRDELPGTAFTGADDLIDDPSHGATDASPDGGGTHAWGADPDRGIVYVTPETSRLDAGTQDIDLADGFTWSIWVKTDGNQTVDSGADTIMGSRSGTWNKLQVTALQRWVDIGGYNVDDGQWHHIAVVGTDSPGIDVSMYIDGAFVGNDTTTFGASTAINDPLEIGGTSQFGEDMAGCISDVAVWNTALPVSLITDLSNDAAVIVDDLTAPIIATTTPADDDPDATALTLQAILDEPVVIGTGDIRIVNTTNPGTTTIAVTDGSQVTVSGAAITITPTVPLVAGDSYAIEMDAGVVSNLSGLPFAGILDQVTWNFTVDSTPPALVSTDPADEATGVEPSANLSATFDEPMAKGTGNILVKNLTDVSTVTIDVNSAEVSISGSVVTINPNALLLGGKAYAVQIEAGAVTDLPGNAFGGVLDDTTWNFTTGTPATGLLVYEGFQYADPVTSDILGGQPDDPGVTDTDATGLSGTWNDAVGGNTGDTMFLKTGSLPFGDHTSAGNHVGYNSNANNDTYHRDLTADAALGVGGNPEIWFSFLADKQANNFNAGEGGLAITNQVLGNSRIFENGGTTPMNGLAGFGFGPDTVGNNWTLYAWDGSTIAAGDAVLPVSVGAGDVRLLVGHISFDTGTGGADVFTAYEYQLNGGAIVGGTLSQIASPLEVDIDQNLLDTLNVTRQVNTNYDEIRIGTTLGDAVPGAVLPDLDPPVWAATYPKADTPTNDGFTVRGQIDENGTAYYVVLASGAAAPSSAQVVAGNDSLDAPATASGSIALTASTEGTDLVTGLMASTTYDVWFVAEDGIPNLQAVPVMVSITTSGAATIYDTWAAGFGLSGGDEAPNADTESPTPDGLEQLLEFAFGTDPNAVDNIQLTVTDANTFTPGTPRVDEIFSGGNPVKLRYMRRKDHVAAGLTYTPEFYDGIGAFYEDPAAPVPTVVSTMPGDYEVVEVPFPLFDSSGEKASALVAQVVVALN